MEYGKTIQCTPKRSSQQQFYLDARDLKSACNATGEDRGASLIELRGAVISRAGSLKLSRPSTYYIL
jgi:hypothetical protein